MFFHTRIIVAVLVLVCIGENGLVESTSCSQNYIPVGNKCYRFHQYPSTWSKARQICGQDRAALASVKTNDEKESLLDHIEAHYGGQYWLSGSLDGGKWVWKTDFSPMNGGWFGRSPRRSGNFCAYFCSFTRRYWDGSCNEKKKFICEK